MKLIKILIVLLLLIPLAYAQNYQVDRYVMASGGGEMASTNYSANGTAGQSIVGKSQSTSYTIESGFWVGAGAAAGCEYVVGDANGSGEFDGIDVIYSVNYFKGIGGNPACPFGSCPIPPCNAFYYCGDVNGSCEFDGIDVTYMVNKFKGGPAEFPCPACLPAGPLVTAASGRTGESTEVLKKH